MTHDLELAQTLGGVNVISPPLPPPPPPPFLVTGSPTTVHIEIVLVLKEILQLILPTTTAEYDYAIICMKDF